MKRKGIELEEWLERELNAAECRKEGAALDQLDQAEINRLFEKWCAEWREAHPEEEKSLLEMIEIHWEESQDDL